MNEQEINHEIAKLQAEKEALSEQKKTDVEKQQRDTILQNHPFCKKLRAVFIEANAKNIVKVEAALHAQVDTQIEQAEADFIAESTGQVEAARESRMYVKDVADNINAVVNGKEMKLAPSLDLGTIVKTRLIINSRMAEAKSKLKKNASDIVFKAKEDMRRFITETLMPRLYEQPDFQEVLKLSDDDFLIWLNKLRQFLGLPVVTDWRQPTQTEHLVNDSRLDQNSTAYMKPLDTEKAFRELTEQQTSEELAEKRDGHRPQIQ